MHTRGVTKRMEKEQETEEDRREEETEVVTDTEMEQQASKMCIRDRTNPYQVKCGSTTTTQRNK